MELAEVAGFVRTVLCGRGVTVTSGSVACRATSSFFLLLKENDYDLNMVKSEFKWFSLDFEWQSILSLTKKLLPIGIIRRMQITY